MLSPDGARDLLRGVVPAASVPRHQFISRRGSNGPRNIVGKVRGALCRPPRDDRVGDGRMTIAFVDPSTKVREFVTIQHGVMIHEAGVSDMADATLTATVPAMLALLGQQATPADLMAKGLLAIDGDRSVLLRFGSLFETPPALFPLVTR